MSLSSEVQSRVSAAQLRGLTNIDDTSATSLGSTILTTVCGDVTDTDFPLIAQVAYDGTNAAHVGVAVPRVVARLVLLKGDKGADALMAASERMLVALRSTTSRGRILPRTNVQAVPTSEDDGSGGTPRPDFDRRRFDDFIPGQPPAPESWGR